MQVVEQPTAAVADGDDGPVVDLHMNGGPSTSAGFAAGCRRRRQTAAVLNDVDHHEVLLSDSPTPSLPPVAQIVPGTKLMVSPRKKCGCSYILLAFFFFVVFTFRHGGL